MACSLLSSSLLPIPPIHLWLFHMFIPVRMLCMHMLSTVHNLGYQLPFWVSGMHKYVNIVSCMYKHMLHQTEWINKYNTASSCCRWKGRMAKSYCFFFCWWIMDQLHQQENSPQTPTLYPVPMLYPVPFDLTGLYSFQMKSNAFHFKSIPYWLLGFLIVTILLKWMLVHFVFVSFIAHF